MKEILYKRVRDNKEILKRGFQMKEQELNTMMSVVTDPINNVYRVHNYAEAEEIRRMCRVFESELSGSKGLFKWYTCS